jgi:hypothetical protein
MSVAVFRPEILQSYPSFQKFLTGSEAIQEITLEAQSPKQIGHGESLMQDRWKVAVMDISAAVKKICSVYVKAISSFLASIQATALSIYCLVLAHHLSYDQNMMKAFNIYQERLLVPSLNMHQLSTSDFYLSDPMPTLAVQDQKVRDVLFSHTQRPLIKFFHENGACRGISNWFAHLYFQTHDQFQDREAHLMAVAKQFSQGASREAALLHCVEDESKVLKLRNIEGISLFPWVESEGKKLHQFLLTIPNGLFEVGLYRHRINLIKTDDDQFYIFDPNTGLLKLNREEAANFILREGPRFDPSNRVYINMLVPQDARPV